jgi:hypothetical protein
MSSRYPEAFGRDPFIGAELFDLVLSWGVKTIVETGTYLGHSTLALASMGPLVFTIENDERLWSAAQYLDKEDNVRRLRGDSALMLEVHFFSLKAPVLFYLDAHWGEHSPLLDELGVIAKFRGPVIIAIHDFFNPEHAEYGYDTWDIGPYRLELIAPALDRIYGAGGWRHWYNEQAAGLKRGIIYVEPEREGFA